MILLISPKNKYATRRFVEEAGKAGMAMEIMDVQALAERDFEVDINNYDCLFIRQANPFFDQLINLAKKFREAGKYVVDGEFITGGFETSKAVMYRRLGKVGLEIPETYGLEGGLRSSPPNIGGVSSETRRGGINSLSSTTSPSLREGTPPILGGELPPTPRLRRTGRTAPQLFPFILKWIYGFGGKHAYLIKSQEDYQHAINLHPMHEWLAQEYIEADCEYEVYVVGGKAVGPVLKFQMNKDGFKADLENYETIRELENQRIRELAQAAAGAAGYELAKVDILEKDKRLYILEVNRTPSFIPYEQFSGYNMAGECIKYIFKQLTIND